MSGGPAVIDFAELTLEARSLPEMVEFYARRLGLEVLSQDHDRAWLAVGSRARLGIWTPGEKEFGDRGGRHVHFAVAVDPGGLDRLLERLREGGYACRGPVEHEGGDRSIYFEDPEGNVVEAWDFFERGEGRREGVAALR